MYRLLSTTVHSCIVRSSDVLLEDGNDVNVTRYPGFPAIFKTKCQKLRQNKHGNLYNVKTYHYDKLSKLERAKRKEQKENKRLQDLSSIELSKIVDHMFNSN